MACAAHAAPRWARVRNRASACFGLLLAPFLLGGALPPAPSFREPVAGAASTATLGSRYAALQPAACRAEIQRRKLPVRRWGGAAPGVATPMRIEGELGGVRFVTPGKKSPYGILDCRLALTLAELGPVLRRHGVTVVRVDNLYRPNAKLPGRRKPSQHSYGLAIDIYGFELEDGTEWNVERDFSGRLGDPVCGPAATAPTERAAAIGLRNLVCDVARSGLFHHLLTPNHDAAHRNHFHFDIARGARSRLLL